MTTHRFLPARACFSLAIALPFVWMAALSAQPAQAAKTAQAARLSAAKVTLLTHPAQLRAKGATGWRPLALGQPINQGDTIRTGHGARVEVTLSPKRVFRVGPATEVAMDTLAYNRFMESKTRVRVKFGRVWNTLGQPLRPGKELYEVVTTTATIGVKGTRFGVELDEETQGLAVSVVKGQVAAGGSLPASPTEVEGPQEIAGPQEVSRGDWLEIVKTMQKLIITPDGQRKLVNLTQEDMNDGWMKFNQQQDEAMNGDHKEPEEELKVHQAQEPVE